MRLPERPRAKAPARPILKLKVHIWMLNTCLLGFQLPLDVRELGCDWLSGTARKYLRGLRGAGFLYASRWRRFSVHTPIEKAVLLFSSQGVGISNSATL